MKPPSEPANFPSQTDNSPNAEQPVDHLAGDSEALFELSQAILDEVNCSILAALSNQTLTANQLVKQLRMPMTTCYRRLNWLAQRGLVEETVKRRSGRGPPYKVYNSLLDSLALRYEGSTVRLDVSLNHMPQNPITYHQRFGVVQLPEA